MKLWAAQAVSAVGARITRTVLPIIAILLIDATPTEVAILSALGFAPSVIVGLFAGGIADRRAKRPLMIGADIFRALIILSIPLAANSGVLSMGQIYLVAALTGAAVLPYFVERLPGTAGYRARIGAPLENFPSGDPLADLRRFHALIEREARRNPGQYLWLHKRFKGLDWTE